LRILLDQNIPQEVTSWLREKRPNWLIQHVNEVGLAGQTDPQVFIWAQSNKATIVTYDEDFADARLFPLGLHHGIIRLRVWPTTVEMTENALERLLVQVPEEQIIGSLVIIDRDRIRLRQKS